MKNARINYKEIETRKILNDENETISKTHNLTRIIENLTRALLDFAIEENKLDLSKIERDLEFLIIKNSLIDFSVTVRKNLLDEYKTT